MPTIILIVLGFGAWLHWEPDFGPFKRACINWRVRRRVESAYRKRMKTLRGA